MEETKTRLSPSLALFHRRQIVASSQRPETKLHPWPMCGAALLPPSLSHFQNQRGDDSPVTARASMLLRTN